MTKARNTGRTAIWSDSRAKVLGTTSHFNSMAIAFRNPDGTIVVVTQNALEDERPFEFADPADASRGFKATLAPRSFNTFVIE